MLSHFRKLLFVLVSILIFNTSSAYEMCSLEGDFVPWPWSEQHYSKVVDHQWVMINANGTPSSQVSISKSNFLLGAGNPYFVMKEQDMNGNTVSWGLADSNQEGALDGQIKFNVYQSGPEINLTTYKVKLGYWKSPNTELTEEEEQLDPEISPFRSTPNFLDRIFKPCGIFKGELDSIVGIILEKTEKNVEDVLETRKYYGVTETPIYADGERQ